VKATTIAIETAEIYDPNLCSMQAVTLILEQYTHLLVTDDKCIQQTLFEVLQCFV